MSHGLELLTTSEMSQADLAAVDDEAGPSSSFELMVGAGEAVAQAVLTGGGTAWPQGPGHVLFLCGPGNNGGDGFVAAVILAGRGLHIDVVLLGDRLGLTGDAAQAAARWTGPVLAWDPALLDRADVVVDGLFGAGLSRPLAGDAAEIVAALNAAGKSVLAIDVPSGLDGTTGAAVGPVVQATRSLTFFRRKPGHVLLPGRQLCGVVELADIGIPGTVLDDIDPMAFANAPGLWRAHWPALVAEGHKYSRGHALVVSGGIEMSGAARLAARGALRIGAGLVTIAAPNEALPAHAAQVTAILLARGQAAADLTRHLADKRKTAVVIGPGLGLDGGFDQVLAVLKSEAAAVLDADAITAGSLQPDALFEAIAARPEGAVVLTPHEGEFARLFPDLAQGRPDDKLSRARAAAARCGAIILLKGADTVIAAPDGRAAINENAPPWLATAGSGDVLAGLIGGLLAQWMPAWEAACAAAWLHGACAARFGPGLIAEDLAEEVPGVLAALIGEA